MDYNLNFSHLFNKCSEPVVQTVSNIYPEAWKDLDRCDNSTKGVTTLQQCSIVAYASIVINTAQHLYAGDYTTYKY